MGITFEPVEMRQRIVGELIAAVYADGGQELADAVA